MSELYVAEAVHHVCTKLDIIRAQLQEAADTGPLDRALAVLRRDPGGPMELSGEAVEALGDLHDALVATGHPRGVHGIARLREEPRTYAGGDPGSPGASGAPRAQFWRIEAGPPPVLPEHGHPGHAGLAGSDRPPERVYLCPLRRCTLAVLAADANENERRCSITDGPAAVREI